MDRRLLVSSVVGMALLASAGARAGTLTNATWFQVTEASVAGVVLGVPMTRTSGQLGASGTSTATSLAVSLSYPDVTTQVIFPKTPNGLIDVAITVTQGGPQAITATLAMGSGTPGIPGTLIVMTAGHNAMGANQSMFKVGVNTLLRIPLSHGMEAQFTGTFATPIGNLALMTVEFYAWTPGTLILTGLSSRGLPLPNLVAMGSFDLTQRGGGTVTLVAPSKVTIYPTAAQRRTASFTRLVLTFVPEPDSLLLLGVGALAFAFAGRRRPR